MTLVQTFLEQMNQGYLKLHKEYEELFWISYMGDHSVDKRMNTARAARDAFQGSTGHLQQAQELLKKASPKDKKRLNIWIAFFKQYQSPAELFELRSRIGVLESELLKKRASRTEGYTDPHTGEFVPASYLKMRTMMTTHEDEGVRKACFDAAEQLATTLLPEYLEIVKLRNEYARGLGYEDFYAFKVEREDGMTKKELFALFDAIYEKTKYAFKDVRKLEKKMLGLRKPWNFSYLMSGDFTKEEDPYFQFEEALSRWGRSFAALGIDYKGGALQLDLLDRKGKWNNGFCHWPDLVHYEKGDRVPGSSNFTCNVVAGQVGSGVQGYNTLFHEGGHAAHFLNAEEQEVILNNEYWPMSMSWAETQSMFLDTLFSSIEWKTRYARNATGTAYPFELFERKERKLAVDKPLSRNSILFVANYEREIYEAKDLTAEKVQEIAKRNHRKYFDLDGDSLRALNVPHIYSWESSGAYHGYALATLALSQWRAYFYKKYGYIVDNPRVGKEMMKVWKLGARHTFKEFVVLATGKKLSPKAFLDAATASPEKAIRIAKKRVARLKGVKEYTNPVHLNAHVRMVSGKEVITDNSISFEDMAKQYEAWVRKQVRTSLKNNRRK
ncbi:MAG: M3 family metallopeptidase [bacterium]|nr:M3 family metallopeptidase [bacterium]